MTTIPTTPYPYMKVLVLLRGRGEPGKMRESQLLQIFLYLSQNL